MLFAMPLCVSVYMCLVVICSSAGKGLTSGSRMWSLTVSSSLSHLYPGSGVVLN